MTKGRGRDELVDNIDKVDEARVVYMQCASVRYC